MTDGGAPASGPSAPDAEPVSSPAPRSGGLRLRERLETLLVAIVIVLFVTTFCVQNSVIPSGSMEDTLLIGDYLLVNRVQLAAVDADAPVGWLGQRPVRRGDVVVFKFPSEPSVDYIKRVIGLPGDLIEIRDKQVFRNGEPVAEPYKRHKTGLTFPASRPGPDGRRDNVAPTLIPPGQVFVLGDNRDYSGDSREWGLVPRSHVTGRAVVVFWSREQRLGAQHLRGMARLHRFLQAFKTLFRDTRWGRIGHVIR